MPHPSTPGLGHYLRDMVYGSLDGAITTFAVVAGAEGADLGARVAVILGLSNVVADGFSMGASNYMAIRSEALQEHGRISPGHLAKHGLATFAAFAVAGLIPLAAYFAPVGHAWIAAGLALGTLVAAGAGRRIFIPNRHPWRLAGEMAGVGILAGAAAYGVGQAARWLIQ